METGNKHFNALTQQKNTVLRLSARLKADSFFYAIFNEKNHMLLSGEMIRFSIEKLKANSDLNHLFDEVCISIDNSIFTFVGSNDIADNKDDLSVFFTHLHAEVRSNTLITEVIEGTSIHTIYSKENANIKILGAHFSNIKFSHFSSNYIGFARNYKPTAIFAHVADNIIHVLCMSEGQFQFYNQFEVFEKEDYLYHIGLVYQQFDMDRNEIPLVLSGEMYPSFSSYNMLKDYFRLIEFPIMKDFTVGITNEDILLSHYFDQFLIIQ